MTKTTSTTDTPQMLDSLPSLPADLEPWLSEDERLDLTAAIV